jgi:hypothetical protein
MPLITDPVSLYHYYRTKITFEQKESLSKLIQTQIINDLKRTETHNPVF